MKNSIRIQIGKIKILIKGDALIIQCLKKYYCDFLIVDSLCIQYVIDVRLTDDENDISHKRYSVNTSSKSQFYIPEKSNYVNVMIDHNRNYCSIKLLKEFNWEQNWADWEFCFRLSTFLFFVKNEQIIVHAAGLLYRGKVYLFTGESGAGKTTAALNCIKGNKKITILNDDTMILYRDQEDNIIVSSAPYKSTSGLIPINGSGKFAGVYRIIKSHKLCLEPMSTAHAMQQIWIHSFCVGNCIKYYTDIYKQFYEFCKKIAQQNQNFYLYTPLKTEDLFKFIYSKEKESHE